MKNKNYVRFIFILFGGLVLIWAGCDLNRSNTNADSQQKTVPGKSVAMVMPVSIDAFDKLKNGAQSVLDPMGIELKVYSAEGDPAKFETTIKSSLLTHPKYIVTVGTQITNTAYGPQFRDQLPTVVATAISDPAKVESLVAVGIDPPRSSKVAIIADTPKEDIFGLLAKTIKDFKPDIKQIGIIYNLAEINSKVTAENSIKAIEATGISVNRGIISNADDISKVTTDLLLKGSEIIVIPLDKYAVEKAATIVQLAKGKNVPVFSLDDGTVEKSGVMAAVSVDYRLVGEQTGKIIAEVEQGKAVPEQIPVIRLENASVYFNESVAKGLGIVLPTSLIGKVILVQGQ